MASDGIKGKLKESQDFKCTICTTKVQETEDKKDDEDKKDEILIGTDQSVEKVSSFCYLGDTLSKDGSADWAVEARVRSG